MKLVGHERKMRYGYIARLKLHCVKIYASPVYAGGRTGFEAPQDKAKLTQRVGKEICPEKAARAAFNGVAPDKHAAFKVNARRHYDGARRQHGAVGAFYAAYNAAAHKYFGTFALPQIKPVGRFERELHSLMISPLVHLPAQGVNRRPLAEIQHTHLHEAFVRRQPHFAAERVNLMHKMSL